MDLPSLSVGLDQVGPSGLSVSIERRVALSTSLLLLKNAEKFQRVYFWGKIAGVAADYFVAQGQPQGQDPFARKSFYSMDCIKWAQLPDVHPVLLKSCSLIRGRFTGSPSHETTVQETGPAPDDNRPELPQEVSALRIEETKGDGSLLVTTRIPEEIRLAATIKSIDYETRIVPRGAFRKHLLVRLSQATHSVVCLLKKPANCKATCIVIQAILWLPRALWSRPSWILALTLWTHLPTIFLEEHGAFNISMVQWRLLSSPCRILALSVITCLALHLTDSATWVMVSRTTISSSSCPRVYVYVCCTLRR